MESVSFVNEEAKAVWEGFRFSLCDPKNATVEGCETETTDEQVSSFYIFISQSPLSDRHRTCL